MTYPRIPDNSRVKLRDGIDADFYEGFGFPGNEGWIRQHDSDRYGPARVYIQWDKDHWAYNGAQDKWTWEDHFDIVEESMSDKQTKQNELQNLLGAFTDALLDIVGDKDQIPNAPQVLEDNQNTEPSYEEVLQAAFKSTADAESFFVVVTRKDDDKGYYPIAYHASRTPRAGLIGQLHLSNITSAFNCNIIEDKLRETE